MPNSPQLPIPGNPPGLRPPPAPGKSKPSGSPVRMSRNSSARPPALRGQSDGPPGANYQNKWQPSGSPQRRGLPPSEGPTSHQTPHVSNGSFTENTSSTVSRNANIDANRDDVQTRNGGTVSNPGDKTNRINSNTVNSKNPEDGDRTNEVRKKSMSLLSKIRKFPKNTWTYMKKNPRKSTLIGGTVALCAIVSLCIAVHGFFPVVVGIGVLLGIVYIIKIAKITPALYQAYKARKSEKKP